MPDGPRRNPLSALQKAESIGADPISRDTMLRGEMPLDPAFLTSIGKSLTDLIGLVLKSPTGSGLPAKLTLGGFDSAKGAAKFYGARKGGEVFEAAPTEIDDAITNGLLDLEQPAQKATAAVRRKIAAALGPSK